MQKIKAHAKQLLEQIIEDYAEKAPQAVDSIEEAFDEMLLKASPQFSESNCRISAWSSVILSWAIGDSSSVLCWFGHLHYT